MPLSSSGATSWSLLAIVGVKSSIVISSLYKLAWLQYALSCPSCQVSERSSQWAGKNRCRLR